MDHDPRQQRILDETRAFVEKEIRPYASEFDRKGALPEDLIQKMAKNKFLAASFPEKYGGLELDPVYYGLFTEEIGKACCSTRTLLTVHTSLVGETLLRCGSTGQKDRWLPLMASGQKIGAFALSEPEVGSDARSIRTSYEKKGDRYFINGKKKWISFGDRADFFIVLAASSGRITAFIVGRECEGVKSRPLEGMLAGRASQIAEVDFRNVAVSGENVLGREGSGFEYVVGTALDHGKYSIAWAGVAVAQEALEAMVGYARRRTQFGERIYHFQLIQAMIADAVTGIHAARALCLKAGEMRKRSDPEAVMETAMAKYFSSKIALKVATDAVQVHGGNGCWDAYPVERLFREAKVLEIIEGTSQIHQVMIAKHGLRKYFVDRKQPRSPGSTDDQS